MPRFSVTVVRGLAVHCLLRPYILYEVDGLAGGKGTSHVPKLVTFFMEGTFVPVSYLLIRSRMLASICYIS